MNQEIRKYLEDTKETVEQQQEGIIDEAFSNIKDKNGEKMDPDKLTKKFEEVEENQMKNEAEMIRAQLSISANLQPLMRDKNNLKELEEATNDILITESVEYSKKLKKDYSEIRSSFRNVMNHLRFDEFGTFDKLKSTQNQDLKDPYLEMQEEILKINQEQKKKGFITSYSEANDSGDEEQLVEDVPLKNTDKLNKSASKPSQKRSVSIRSKKSLPFRSSAGFNKKNQKPDLTGKSTSKLMRAGSARKRKLPPTGKNKEELNQLRELKIDEEKDKILSEFNKIVSKTSTDFKKPKFPNSSRKKVLQPIKSYGKSSSVISDSEAGVTALKNITKYTKPSMLAAQNEAIASILSNKN
uniref:Uncharacterized protein n=1 Tax=Euplotes crassus TaxID=5936 RepID=A0A7S3P2N3_EUPCR|mmetsp:Transcript_8832/g.8374  ORF Transcript_8832/g.8374 Transcript_8832/m.8374 type:complete len:355 (+) Transcript_8832:896-1960(+)